MLSGQATAAAAAAAALSSPARRYGEKRGVGGGVAGDGAGPAVESVTALSAMDVGVTQLHDVRHRPTGLWLHQLTCLRSLTLHCNEISEITGLDALASLQVLDLSSNRIER